jgi:hypothetical protein
MFFGWAHVLRHYINARSMASQQQLAGHGLVRTTAILVVMLTGWVALRACIILVRTRRSGMLTRDPRFWISTGVLGASIAGSWVLWGSTLGRAPRSDTFARYLEGFYNFEVYCTLALACAICWLIFQFLRPIARDLGGHSLLVERPRRLRDKLLATTTLYVASYGTAVAGTILVSLTYL